MDLLGELSLLTETISKSKIEIMQCKTMYIFTQIRSELPSCIGAQFLTIQKYFDELDSLVVSLVIDMVGAGNTTWTSPEDKKVHSISEKYFKVKTNKDYTRRLYLYRISGSPSCVFQQEQE